MKLDLIEIDNKTYDLNDSKFHYDLINEYKFITGNLKDILLKPNINNMESYFFVEYLPFLDSILYKLLSKYNDLCISDVMYSMLRCDLDIGQLNVYFKDIPHNCSDDDIIRFTKYVSFPTFDTLTRIFYLKPIDIYVSDHSSLRDLSTLIGRLSVKYGFEFVDINLLCSYTSYI